MLSRRFIQTLLFALCAAIGVTCLLLTWHRQDQVKFVDELKANHFRTHDVHVMPSRAMRQGFIQQWPAVIEDLGLENGMMNKNEVVIVYMWCTDYESEFFDVPKSRDIHTVHDLLTKFQCVLVYRYLMATQQGDIYPEIGRGG